MDFKDTVNSELVGNVGNFIHRTLTFLNNKLEGKFQAPSSKFQLDSDIDEASVKVFEEVSADLERCSFVGAVNKILKYSQLGNQYFDAQKPWATLKDDRESCEKTIYNCLNIVYSLCILLNPFTPNASDELSKLLNLEPLNSGANGNLSESKFAFERLDPEKINVSQDLKPLFSKIEDEQIETFQIL